MRAVSEREHTGLPLTITDSRRSLPSRRGVPCADRVESVYAYRNFDRTNDRTTPSPGTACRERRVRSVNVPVIYRVKRTPFKTSTNSTIWCRHPCPGPATQDSYPPTRTDQHQHSTSVKTDPHVMRTRRIYSTIKT